MSTVYYNHGVVAKMVKAALKKELWQKLMQHSSIRVVKTVQVRILPTPFPAVQWRKCIISKSAIEQGNGGNRNGIHAEY